MWNRVAVHFLSEVAEARWGAQRYCGRCHGSTARAGKAPRGKCSLHTLHQVTKGSTDDLQDHTKHPAFGISMSIMSMHSTTSPSRFTATLSTALISATYLGQFTPGHIHSGEFSHPLFTAAAAVTSRQSKAGKIMPEIALRSSAPGFRRLAKSPWTMVWNAQRVPLAVLCFLAESELVGSALSHYGMPPSLRSVSSVSTKMPRRRVVKHRDGAGRGREFWLVALLWHSSTFLLGLCWGVGLLIGHRASPMSFVNRSIFEWSPMQLMKLYLVCTGAGNVAAWPAAAPPHRSHRSSHQAAARCMSRPPSIHDIDNDIVLLFSFFPR